QKDIKHPRGQVMAVAEGYGCDWATIGAGDKQLMLRLVKDVPLHGRILDPDGTPVVGAKLTVTGLWAPHGDDLGSYLEATRKDDGYWRTKVWDGPVPGRATVLTTGADGRFHMQGAGRERIVSFRLEGPAIASVHYHVMTRAAETVRGAGAHW